MMHLRKWLRILINRSLVLGTVDRSSVHDLVLDWGVAQHTKDELRNSHRLIVDAFRAARPIDAYGRRKYDPTRQDDPVSAYVCTEIEKHVNSSGDAAELERTGWLLELPQDRIVQSVASKLGAERLSMLASQADAAKDYWLSARLWSCLGTTYSVMGGGAAGAKDAATKSLSAITMMSENAQSMDVEDLRFTQATVLFKAFDLMFISEHLTEFQEILSSQAAARAPAETVGALALLGVVRGSFFTGDMTPLTETYLAVANAARTAAKADPDPTTRTNCDILQYGLISVMELCMLDHSFDWTEFYGNAGSALMDVLRKFDYAVHHTMLLEVINGDWMHIFPTFSPILLHWGDLENTADLVRRAHAFNKLCLQEPWKAEDSAGILFFPGVYASFYQYTGLVDGRDTLLSLMGEARMTYRTADATADICKEQVPWIRKRGDTTVGLYWGSVEFLAWLAKLGYVLLAENPGVSAEEVLTDLPTVDNIVEMSMTMSNISQQHGMQSPYNL
jgi:propanediol dehydratase small subunit